jgi:hypothetical protein
MRIPILLAKQPDRRVKAGAAYETSNPSRRVFDHAAFARVDAWSNIRVPVACTPAGAHFKV